MGLCDGMVWYLTIVRDSLLDYIWMTYWTSVDRSLWVPHCYTWSGGVQQVFQTQIVIGDAVVQPVQSTWITIIHWMIHWFEYSNIEKFMDENRIKACIIWLYVLVPEIEVSAMWTSAACTGFFTQRVSKKFEWWTSDGILMVELGDNDAHQRCNKYKRQYRFSRYISLYFWVVCRSSDNNSIIRICPINLLMTRIRSIVVFIINRIIINRFVDSLPPRIQV